jgi:hypothetical protein
MTITNEIVAQSVGTSTNIGNSKFPIKVTLEATTTAAQIEALLVNGPTGTYDTRQPIILHYAFSSFSHTAAAAVLVLGFQSRFLEIPPKQVAGKSSGNITLLEPAPGSAYLYFWLDVPATEVASALSVNVIQYP